MRKRYFVAFCFIGLLFTTKAVTGQSVFQIAFVGEKNYGQSDKETRDAFDFLSSNKAFNAEFILLEDLQRHPKILKKYSVVWIHHVTPPPLLTHDEKWIRALTSWIYEGGKLLLSQEAFQFLVPLGFETIIPRDSIKPVTDDGYGRRLGLHAFLDHPVFCQMNGGAYLLRPVQDTVIKIFGYFGSEVPSGKVIAIDWDYIFLRETSKLMTEYPLGKGNTIAIGAYLNFSIPNYNWLHLELFTENLLRYLSGSGCKTEVNYWDYSIPVVSECPGEKSETDQPLIMPPASKPWNIAENDPLMMTNPKATGNFWDQAGERMLTMGKEQGGIEEIWVHPYMVLRDYEVGIIFGYRDSVYWLSDERPAIEVHPGYFSRTYKFPRAHLTEIITNDPELAAGVIHYAYQGVYEARLVFRFKSNMRLMWPYSEKVTGSLCHYWDYDLDALTVRNASGKGAVTIGANRKPAEHLAGQYDSFLYQRKKFEGIPGKENEIDGILQYDLKMNDLLDLIITAGESSDFLFKTIVADPYAVFEKANAHANRLLNQGLMITTPDENFNRGYRWSLLGTDRFFVNTPGMGKSLVAGYSTTQTGWDGGHKINGRPGYGWYFGRDGAWSGMALLDYGDEVKVKEMLRFFQKYQDLSGKIFHEATTSGVIHYDAADATPLYIVLFGKYFRHTNDIAFLRESWPHLKKAVDFCFSTDTDMDHLIENTNVGHGWVEGGELYGSHATIYMAGCWAAALKETFTMAMALNDPEADSYRLESNLVTDLINNQFWSPKNNFFAYGMNRDRTFRAEPTVLPSVPLYFKVAEKRKAATILQQYASNAFTTNWGMRIIRDDSRLFKPSGYHYGSVWPLFTGWTSLAEYAYGNDIQGFSHLISNLNIYQNWALGFTEEVLNGEVYEPSGVCPHQCWSETMVLQPSIEGMLGMEVNSGKNIFHLAPHLPADWDSITVDNLKMDSRKFNFRMQRTEGKYSYRFFPSFSREMQIEFMPSFPSGTKIVSARINGKEVALTSFTTPQAVTALLLFPLSEELKLEINVEDGISVLPLVQNPKPGYPAEGLRIISYGLSGSRYSIEVEGPAGSSSQFEVYFNGNEPGNLVNGKFLSRHGNRLTIGVTFEKGEMKYVKKTVSIELK